MYDTWTACGYSTQKPCLGLTHTSNLIGPVLGGMLAEPGKNYPSVFPPGSIWTTYPFLLPNPVVASLQLFALILTSLFLEETHPELREIPDWALAVGRDIFGRQSSHGQEYNYEMVDTNQEGFESLETLDNTQQEDVSNVSDHEDDKIIRPMRALTKQLILQTLSVSLLAFHKVSSDAIMPAYLAAPPDISTQKLAGGFGYGGPTIGFILLSHAINAAIAQIRFVSWFINKMGPLQAYLVVLCAYPVVYTFTPFLPGTLSEVQHIGTNAGRSGVVVQRCVVIDWVYLLDHFVCLLVVRLTSRNWD